MPVLNGLLPGALHRYIEFINGLTGACGPNSLSMAYDWSTQSYAGNRTPSVVALLEAQGILPHGSNGVSDPDQIRRGAIALGLPVKFFHDWSQPYSQWVSDLDGQLDAGNIVVLNVHNGQALVDSRTGRGENAVHLQNHVIAVCGKWAGGMFQGQSLPAGYFCLDGDNFDAGDVIQFYSAQVLAAALPAALLGIAALVTAKPQGGNTMPVPAGWKDDGTTLIAPNGKQVHTGFRTRILNDSTWQAGDQPVTDELTVDHIEMRPGGDNSRGQTQFTMNHQFGWYPARGVFDTELGPEAVWLRDQVSALQAEVASLKAAPAPAPAPAPLDPAIKSDLTAAQQDASDLSGKLTDIVSRLPKS